jgi:hypothetical protein
LPDWLVERGIGETRAALVDNGEIVEARIIPEDVVAAGAVLEARLKQVGQPAIAVAEGREYLLPKGAPGVAEGGLLAIEVTREWIGGAEPWKRPMARVAEGPPRSAPQLRGRLLPLPSAVDPLSDAGWSDLLEEARSGIVRFDGGELHIFATPAMTLIDVDGTLPPETLAKSAAVEAARAILRHGIGGSIGIDFPTVSGKEARAAIDRAIDDVLPKPFERTSLNGFGFLQIVRPRCHASLVELAQDGPAFEARALLRRLAFEPPGGKRIVANPAIARLIDAHEDWTDRLSRQLGGGIELRADAALPMSGGYAEPL